MGTYIVDVSAIMHEAGASLEIDDDVPLGSMTVGDTVASFDSGPRLTASIANAGDSLVLTGSVSVNARLECSRCLEPFLVQIDGAIEGVITAPQERDMVGEDEEWYPLAEDGSVDLLPSVHASLALEIPYAPLHDDSCKGICPTCGCDLNRDDCSCTPEPVAPESPFAALRDLVDGDAQD